MEASINFYDPLAWFPPTNCYPTKDDVMRFYMSRIKTQKDRKGVIIELATFVREIWEKGDGCPKKLDYIVDQFNELFAIYRNYH